MADRRKRMKREAGYFTDGLGTALVVMAIVCALAGAGAGACVTWLSDRYDLDVSVSERRNDDGRG